MSQKSLLTRLGEAVDQHREAKTEEVSNYKATTKTTRLFRWLVPNGGTLLIALLLIVTQSVWARGSFSPTSVSTNTISYQGRLADTGGNPITGLQNMEFRLYDVPSGGVPLWDEYWTGGNAVQVSDGLFNVMLGSLNSNLSGVVQGKAQLYLGITVGTDSEMLPRVQLGSVPFSMQALTVTDGSITTDKIADGSVTQTKLGPDVNLVPPDGSITTEKLANNAVTINKISANAVGSSQIIDGSIGVEDLANGSVTQVKAPSLIRSLNGNNEIILSGNSVVQANNQGYVNISYPCFPNSIRTFIAMNGHIDANGSQVIGHNGAGNCSTIIRISPVNTSNIRINWIAIGN